MKSCQLTTIDAKKLINNISGGGSGVVGEKRKFAKYTNGGSFFFSATLQDACSFKMKACETRHSSISKSVRLMDDFFGKFLSSDFKVIERS